MSEAQRNGIRKLQKKQDGVYNKWLQAEQAAAAKPEPAASDKPAEEEKKAE